MSESRLPANRPENAVNDFKFQPFQPVAFAWSADAQAGERLVESTVSLADEMAAISCKEPVVAVIQADGDMPAYVFISYELAFELCGEALTHSSVSFKLKLNSAAFRQILDRTDSDLFHRTKITGCAPIEKSKGSGKASVGPMKAFQLIQHGAPGVFELRDVPDPQPKADEVVVKVAACGLNHLDLWTEQGALPVSIQLPRTPGCEIAGVIAATGASVKDWHMGDRVAVQSNLYCGTCEYCLRGRESVCLKSEILGVQRDGGFAEQVAVPANTLVGLPDEVSFETSAALTLAGSTAMHMLTDRTTVEQGDWVLVMAGASGVGSAAIQIAKKLGAYVIATGSTEAKREFARQLGADYQIDTSKNDWVAEIRKLTNKRGVDIVVEHIGGEILVKCFECLARGGTIVTCGATSGREVCLKLWPLFAKEHSLVGSYGRNRRDITATLDWAAEGKIQATIHRTYSLAQTASAFNELRDRAVLGKLIVAP